MFGSRTRRQKAIERAGTLGAIIMMVGECRARYSAELAKRTTDNNPFDSGLHQLGGQTFGYTRVTITAATRADESINPTFFNVGVTSPDKKLLAALRYAIAQFQWASPNIMVHGHAYTVKVNPAVAKAYLEMPRNTVTN